MRKAGSWKWIVFAVAGLAAGCGGSDGAGGGDGSVELACPAPVEVRTEMLRLVNEARAAGGRCGQTEMAPSGPVQWNDALKEAALEHSEDMAHHNFFDHTGSDGLRVGDRATAAGYVWRKVGENLAAGSNDPGRIVQSWLGSEAHCQVLLDPDFRDMGVACVHDAGADHLVYWTQVLGLPR